MNNFVGKICPFCKTAFKEDDDVVVCSQCEMPHHKDCWVENNGCTTFGCLGTIESAGNTATTVTSDTLNYEEAPMQSSGEFVFCTKCGTRNGGSAAFCSNCGNRLKTTSSVETPVPVVGVQNTAATQSQQYAGTYTAGMNNYQNGYANTGYGAYQLSQIPAVAPEIQQLVQTNQEYYLPKFYNMKASNTQTSWNWPAFLVTPYWMIYRKMYGMGAAVLAANFVITLIMTVTGAMILSLLSLAGYIVLGIYGNYLYMTSLERKASQAQSMTEPFKTHFIIQNGGVNTLATVLTLIGYAILTSIVGL